MNKSDLVTHIARQTKLRPSDVALTLDTFIATMHTELSAGTKVSIQGLGTFTAKGSNRTKVYDFIRKETVEITPKKKFTWTPASIYKP